MASISAFKPHSCHACDKRFDRSFNLRRHVKTMHGEEEEEERSVTDDSEPEHSATDDSDASVDSDAEPEDNVAYREWYKRARLATREMRTRKYEKYVDEGMDEDLAEEKAGAKVAWAVKRDFFDSYGTFLSQNVHLKDDDTHQEIVADLEEKTDKGVDVSKALKITLAKYRPKFEGLFQMDKEDDDDNEEMEREREDD